MRPAIAALGLLLSTSLASAADLGGPYGGSLKDEPIVAVPFSWTGFYIGANVGYGWGDADANPFPPGTPGFPLGLDPDSEPEGWFGGGQIGYNHQTGSVVFGIEVDYQGTGMDDTLNFDVGQFGGVGRIKTEINSFGSVRGRLGVPFDRVLPYFTAGFAWADVDSDTTVWYPPVLPANTWRGDDSAVHTGWAIGGGLEVAFSPNWTAKAEYLYLDLGDKSYTTTFVNGVGVVADTYRTDADLSMHTVRVGVNYKFGL